MPTGRPALEGRPETASTASGSQPDLIPPPQQQQAPEQSAIEDEAGGEPAPEQPPEEAEGRGEEADPYESADEVAEGQGEDPEMKEEEEEQAEEVKFLDDFELFPPPLGEQHEYTTWWTCPDHGHICAIQHQESGAFDQAAVVECPADAPTIMDSMAECRKPLVKTEVPREAETQEAPSSEAEWHWSGTYEGRDVGSPPVPLQEIQQEEEHREAAAQPRTPPREQDRDANVPPVPGIGAVPLPPHDRPTISFCCHFAGHNKCKFRSSGKCKFQHIPGPHLRAGELAGHWYALCNTVAKKGWCEHQGTRHV